jgi:hypothetical protein
MDLAEDTAYPTHEEASNYGVILVLLMGGSFLNASQLGRILALTLGILH